MGDEVQEGDHQDGDRPVEVEQAADLGVVQDALGVADVGQDHGGAALVAGEQGAGVDGDDRVVVDVGDAGFGVDGARHLAGVALAGQAGADVEELRDAGLGQVADSAAEEGAVLADHGAGGGGRGQHDLGGGAVDLEVVLAAEHVVVHPGRVRLGLVDLRGQPVRQEGCGFPAQVLLGHRAVLLVPVAAAIPRRDQINR